MLGDGDMHSGMGVGGTGIQFFPYSAILAISDFLKVVLCLNNLTESVSRVALEFIDSTFPKPTSYRE